MCDVRRAETRLQGGSFYPDSAPRTCARRSHCRRFQVPYPRKMVKAPIDLKVGAVSCLVNMLANTIKMDAEAVLILSESEIYGVVESDPRTLTPFNIEM